MAELVDVPDLGSGALRRESSSLSGVTLVTNPAAYAAKGIEWVSLGWPTFLI